MDKFAKYAKKIDKDMLDFLAPEKFYRQMELKEAERKKRDKKKNFYHRSRGAIFNKTVNEIDGILEDCIERDYYYDGEDEYPVDNFNHRLASRLLVKWFIKKHLI